MDLSSYFIALFYSWTGIGIAQYHCLISEQYQYPSRIVRIPPRKKPGQAYTSHWKLILFHCTSNVGFQCYMILAHMIGNISSALAVHAGPLLQFIVLLKHTSFVVLIIWYLLA